MLKYFTLMLLLVFSVSFSSCFSLIEEVRFEKDGSGIFSTTIDLSEIMGIMGAFLPDTMQSDVGFVPFLQEDLAVYQAIEGISQVKAHSPKKNVYQISYHFSNIAALNKALNTSDSTDRQAAKTTDKISKLHYQKKKLRRHLQLPPLQEDDNLMDGLNIDENLQKQFFGDLSQPTYQFVYHFPKKIKKTMLIDSIGKVNFTEKTAEFTYDLFDFIKGKQLNIEHEVKMKGCF